MNWKLKYVALCSIAFFALSESPLHATSVNCGSSPTILQNKIDSAKPGETLFISGNCTGSKTCRINKNLTLRGPANLSSSSDVGQVVFTDRASVTLSNLNINAGNVNSGILLSGASVNLSNVVVEAQSVGIRAGLNSHANINGGVFRNNSFTGINIAESSAAIVSGVTVEGNGTGFFVSHSSSAITQNNTIDQNGRGFVVENNSSIFIENSTK